MENCYDCKKSCGYVPKDTGSTKPYANARYMPAPVSYVINYRVNAGGNYNFKNQNKVGG